MSIFDSVIFSLTLYKVFTLGRGIPLLDVIVRDGTFGLVTYALSLIVHIRGHVFLVRAILLFLGGLLMIHKN